MGEIVLRDYQIQGIKDIRQFWIDGGRSCMLQAQTGSGKTVLFSYMASEVSKKGNKSIILTHRTEILTQSGGILSKFGINPNYIRSGTTRIPDKAHIVVIMSQTFRNRLKNKNWLKWFQKEISLIIIDEAHRQDFNSLFEQGFITKKQKVIGFTATPIRGGSQRQLGLDYEKIIKTVEVQELIQTGNLVTDVLYEVGDVDLAGLKFNKMKGDFSESDQFQRFNSPKLYGGVIREYLDKARGRKAICFCVNIEHAINTTIEFRKKGIDARFVCSEPATPKIPSKETLEKYPGKMVIYEEKLRCYNLYLNNFGELSGDRSVMVQKFDRGEYDVLVNVDIFTTGFDVPSIGCIIANRATSSLSLWLQMLGRGSRPYEGKDDFIVLDFGGNAKRLGHYSENREWSLWHHSTNTGNGVPPIKDCGGCNRPIMASMPICHWCGYKFPKPTIKDAELIETAYNPRAGEVVKVKPLQQMSVTEISEYAKMKGYKQAWLWRKLYYQHGENGILEIGELERWGNKTISKAINFCKNLNEMG